MGSMIKNQIRTSVYSFLWSICPRTHPSLFMPVA